MERRTSESVIAEYECSGLKFNESQPVSEQAGIQKKFPNTHRMTFAQNTELPLYEMKSGILTLQTTEPHLENIKKESIYQLLFFSGRETFYFPYL